MRIFAIALAPSLTPGVKEPMTRAVAAASSPASSGRRLRKNIQMTKTASGPTKVAERFSTGRSSGSSLGASPRMPLRAASRSTWIKSAT
jgi:hypothetical protein